MLGENDTEYDRAETAVSPNDEAYHQADSFDSFVASITSPELRAVLLHWRSAASGRQMPSWEQIRPARITKQLPIVWAYKYDRVTSSFVGRLAGDKINQIVGRNLRGLPLEKVFQHEGLTWLQRTLKRVAEEPAIYYGTGTILKWLNRGGTGQRIILPLSSDGIVANGILGATEYHYGRGGIPLGGLTDNERWFCLRPKRSVDVSFGEENSES